jgi:hypothetical protein
MDGLEIYHWLPKNVETMLIEVNTMILAQQYAVPGVVERRLCIQGDKTALFQLVPLSIIR